MDLRYDLIPPEWFEAIAETLTIGNNKHKADDFSGKTEEEYFRSAMGHIIADRKGTHTDTDDCMPTLVKAAVNLLIIYTKRCGIKKDIDNFNEFKCKPLPPPLFNALDQETIDVR